MVEAQTLSQDDKIFGALSHAAAFLPMTGIVIPALIWVVHHEKSEYIRQQSLQALTWQLFQICLLFGGIAVYVAISYLTFGAAFVSAFLMMEVASLLAFLSGFFAPFCVIGFLILFLSFTTIISIYATLRSIQGYDFTYPFIGQRTRAYLAK